jgi:hypothetical protein
VVIFLQACLSLDIVTDLEFALCLSSGIQYLLATVLLVCFQVLVEVEKKILCISAVMGEVIPAGTS